MISGFILEFDIIELVIFKEENEAQESISSSDYFLLKA
jgi:hypothetical protein